MPKKRKWTEFDLKNAVNASTSLRQVLKKIGLKETGGNYKQIKKYLNQLSIDYTHLTGQGWRKGSTDPVIKAIPLKNILIKNSFYNSNRLRKRLINEKIFKHKCLECNNSKWNGKKIPLELDHINGINTDNRLCNLRLLCPNCHALTSTYRGKNIKK